MRPVIALTATSYSGAEYRTPQVLLGSALARQHDCAQQEHDDRLQQHEPELEECPVGMLAHAEHGPPRLHVHDEQHACPQHGGRIDLEGATLLEPAREAGQQLCDAEPEDDRDQDGEVIERIHR